jgi:hypothetical protein
MTSSCIDRTSRPPAPQWSKRVSPQQPQVSDSIGRGICEFASPFGIPYEHGPGDHMAAVGKDEASVLYLLKST